MRFDIVQNWILNKQVQVQIHDEYSTKKTTETQATHQRLF